MWIDIRCCLISELWNLGSMKKKDHCSKMIHVLTYIMSSNNQ